MRVGGERLMGLAAVALGLFAVVETLRLPEVTLAGGPGTQPLPFVLGAIVALFGATIALRGGGVHPPAAGAGGRARVAATLAAVVVYPLVFERLGFIPSTVLVLAALLLAYGERRPGVVAAVALSATGLTYAVFAVWLKVPLPPGILGP